MPDYIREWLQGWYEGEIILEFIERILRENESLVKRLEKIEKERWENGKKDKQ